jgi:hypothetical protein
MSPASRRRAAAPAACALLVWLSPVGASGRSPGEPIVLAFDEGDLTGVQTVWDARGERAIGHVEYRQVRRGDVLETLRVARFEDGSSDEDLAVARVAGRRLEALWGRSVQRDETGFAVVDLEIDVGGDRLRGSWGPRDERRTFDEAASLPPDTYWGPLVFLVLKNFAANAEEERVVFRTVAPTPSPRVFDLELERDGGGELARAGGPLAAERFTLRPSLHWLLDPLIGLLIPDTRFWTLPGEPPGLALFEGPRNYRRQRIVLR